MPTRRTLCLLFVVWLPSAVWAQSPQLGQDADPTLTGAGNGDVKTAVRGGVGGFRFGRSKPMRRSNV